MNKRLMIAVATVLTFLIAFVGGAYIYAASAEDDIILELTFEQLQTLEKPDRVSFVANTSVTAVSADPEAAPQDVTVSTNVSGSVTEDVVTVETLGAAPLAFTVEEFLATNPFGDIQIWLDEIDAGNYTVEVVEDDNSSAWQYTFVSQDLQDSYIQTLTPQLLGIAEAGAEGFEIVNPAVTFDGEMTFVVTIDQSDNVIDTMEITADSPIVASFDLVNDEVGTVPGQVSFENVTSNVQYTEFTLQDGQSIPTNPLMVLLASVLD